MIEQYKSKKQIERNEYRRKKEEELLKRRMKNFIAWTVVTGLAAMVWLAVASEVPRG